VNTSDQERYRLSQRATSIGAGANTAMALVKMVVGFFGRSPALFADGLHSLSDLLCDGLVMLAAYYGKADADQNHPYGHRRIETIATFALGVLLLLIGFTICGDAIFRILHEHKERPDLYTLWIALFSVISNELLFRYQLRIAKQVQSDLLAANAWHRRSDSWSSLVVLIGIGGALAGWWFLDAIAALVVGALIVRMGVTWGWRALYELSDAGIAPTLLGEIQEAIQSTEGVLHMHQLRTRKMAEKIMLDVHIEIPPYRTASEGHYIAECVRIKLMRTFPGVSDVTVHVDIEDHPEGLPAKMLPSRAELLARLMPQWRELVPESAIKQMVLHYVGYKIEIELHLDSNQVANSLTELLPAFERSIAHEPAVAKIMLHQVC
jgi:cation diffusion facilitator family transporter